MISSLEKGELRALRAKYERMLALRELHDRARHDPTFLEPDPRPEMARLAAEFPGALRELDTLTLALLHERIRALTTADADARGEAPWMHAQALFHRLARGALVVKRWLGETGEGATREAFVSALPSLPWSADAALFADDLATIARPPRGRVMNVVHRRVAAHLGTSEAEVRSLVFGAPTRPRYALPEPDEALPGEVDPPEPDPPEPDPPAAAAGAGAAGVLVPFPSADLLSEGFASALPSEDASDFDALGLADE